MNEKKLSYYMNKSKSIIPNSFEKKLRIAILGSFTLNGLDETLRVKCSEVKIGCSTYVGPYGQYQQEILDHTSNLYKFSPNITFLLLDVRNLLGNYFYFPYTVSEDERKEIINHKFDELCNLIENFKHNSNSKLFLSNFTIPTFSPYGIFEMKMNYGLQEMIFDINSRLKNFAKENDFLYLFDMNRFFNFYGEKNVFDYHQFFVGDIKISLDHIPYLAHELMGFIKAVMGLNKKCIVLDLDNTLWGGIIGEDGFEGIQLGPDQKGRMFVEFQNILLSFHQRGIILAINSKNNFDDAIKVIKEHPYMVLKENNFSSMKINWNDKVSNMKEISNELNIGLDSIVFFDDDPTNRELMKSMIPDVLTVDLPPDAAQFSKILSMMNDFNLLKITSDDLNRGKMYSEQRLRNELRQSTTNLDDFLKQLDIKIKFLHPDEFTIPRISQLTMKTNQFNLTTKRYQEEEIGQMSKSENYLVGCAQIIDKFGDNGITGVYIVNKENNDEWVLDTFLLSCRVMGRRVEDGILSHILMTAKTQGVKKIKGKFIPTKKNKPAEDFLKNYGFTKEEDFWIYSLDNEIKIPKHLEMSLQ
ncbi:MAG: HAD-IIIC family phosphatase [Crenarchaeota archaeon]|nr:MAG: HAD-IIIC family phosphatase [Thermoproteota archaeon]RDJ33326.1 MAG: HAD-IIIC family phosphatase [Thermoproteota archaeon]RDJ36171.1 MAG: HAD-IIIC family phosphatase [Thermoproteota archaeon]RDJ38802.1 MAG: HAD-IIIC family phosphatase [Thermoproteota archaeon]